MLGVFARFDTRLKGHPMRESFALGLLAVVVGTGGAADPAPWKLPDADGQKWAARVRKAAARDGWTVAVKGNEIEVRRDKAVAMEYQAPNGMIGAAPTPTGDRVVKFVLQFGPKVSADDYDRLAAVNAASDKEYDRMLRAVNVTYKFDQFAPTTAEEKERVRMFKEAVAKLPRHALPDLYTPDHSIIFLHGDGWSYPVAADVRAECADVEQVLLRLFGMYSPAAASGRSGFGCTLPNR